MIIIKSGIVIYTQIDKMIAFGCQPAIGSHSQSLTNKLFSLWASRVHEQKGNFFIIFYVLIIFDHANACASMRLLVKIHNICSDHIIWNFIFIPFLAIDWSIEKVNQNSYIWTFIFWIFLLANLLCGVWGND